METHAYVIVSIIIISVSVISFLIGKMIGESSVRNMVEPLKEKVAIHSGRLDALEEKCKENKELILKLTEDTAEEIRELVKLQSAIVAHLTEIINQNNILIGRRPEKG
jgi:hypothetical protein